MNIYSAERTVGREHVPLYPRGFIALRIVQLVLGVVLIGLCSLGVAGYAFSGDVLMLFTALATLITGIYLLVAEYSSPRLYNYWAILGLDIFLVIFWLCSFAPLAAQVSYFFYYFNNSYYGYSYYDKYYFQGATLSWISCLATAAGLGGVQFALFIISLTIHGIMLHRHRMAGLHCEPRLDQSHPIMELNQSLNSKPNGDVPTKFSTGGPSLYSPEQGFRSLRGSVQTGAVLDLKPPNPDNIQSFSYGAPAPALLPHRTVGSLPAQYTGDASDQILRQELALSTPTNLPEFPDNPVAQRHQQVTGEISS
ncbi:hypothetical protein BKA66DRAFT_570650 [Pyrenochaeta sp. MPI-SDFR-AT-0127]|nr:hypothetical protein BKA66DRAFT_570650 [Pyrenochaeta sp. MPI-SDFR-AT-0127]